MAGEPSPLMRVLGSHRLHQSGAGHRVEPEQAVRRRAIVLVEDHQVEVAPVQRCLTESLLDIGAAPSCHVVGPRSSLASGGQPIAGIERADRWPVPDVHPCLDGLVPGHLEAERGEDPDLGFVREVDGDLDPVQALSRGVGQSAFDDVRPPRPGSSPAARSGRGSWRRARRWRPPRRRVDRTRRTRKAAGTCRSDGGSATTIGSRLPRSGPRWGEPSAPAGGGLSPLPGTPVQPGTARARSDQATAAQTASGTGRGAGATNSW